MDNQKQGAELNQLSRILFNKAGSFWQLSVSFEFVAGLMAVAASLLTSTLEVNTIWAIASVIVLAVGLFFRYRFEEIYDVAETMRRQSVLSEGLNWPISRAQFNEWKSRAGKKVLARFSVQSRSDGYYETQITPGAKRLAEMTFESAFWTKNLYKKLRTYLWVILGMAAFIFIVLLTFIPLSISSQSSQTYLIYAIYLTIPALLSIDFLGLVLRIQRSISGLSDVEKSLEVLCAQEAPQVEEVMRLVSEYNCIVNSGVSIPDWLFKMHHDEIQSYWNKQ